jgi:tetratricopeptide (TPR) repeat protein
VAGNVSTATHSVAVLGARDLKDRARSALEALAGSNKHSQNELDEAVKHLAKSLEPDRWADAVHLVEKHGNKVFDEQKKAVKSLQKILKEKGKHADPAIAGDVSSAIDDLATADRLLATVALGEAPAVAADPKRQKHVDKERATAQKELDKGDAELTKGKPDKAIDHYKKAWEHALKAAKEAGKGKK